MGDDIGLHSNKTPLLEYFFLANSRTEALQFRQHKRAAFYNGFKRKVGLLLAKAAALRINLNLEGVPIPSRAYTRTTHRTNTRLIPTALSHHIPLPQACFRLRKHRFFYNTRKALSTFNFSLGSLINKKHFPIK